MSTKIRSTRALVAATLVAGLGLLGTGLPAHAAAPRTHSADLGQSVAASGYGVAQPRRRVSPMTVPQDNTPGQGMAPAPLADRMNARLALAPPSSGASMVPPPHAGLPQTVSTASFAGQGKTGWDPSDANGAAGPFNYVETINEQWAIFGRTGGQQYSTTFNSWFGVTSNPFDPHVVYDPWGGRFIMIADTGSSILLSESGSSNAFGGWCNYTFPTIAGFADFPELGVDYNGIYVSVNMGSPNVNELFSINRSQVESCSSAGYLTWSNLVDASGHYAFSIAPATGQTYSSTEYLVNSQANGGSGLTLWKLSGNSLTRTLIQTFSYTPPSAAAQKGSSVQVETSDCRIAQADYRNGLVAVALTGGYNWGGGNVNSVVWSFKLNPSSNSVAAQGGAGTPGYWYFMPAIAQDSSGNAAVVYAASGSSTYPNIWYLGMNSGLGVVDNNALAWGASYDSVVDPRFGTARWGDFLSARPDPTDGSKVWLTGQYEAATNTWGTWIGQVGSLP